MSFKSKVLWESSRIRFSVQNRLVFAITFGLKWFSKRFYDFWCFANPEIRKKSKRFSPPQKKNFKERLNAHTVCLGKNIRWRMCVQKVNTTCWKMIVFLSFWFSRRPGIPENIYFLHSTFCTISAVQKAFQGHVLRFLRNTDLKKMNCTTEIQNSQFDLSRSRNLGWPSLDTRPLKALEGSQRYLRHDPHHFNFVSIWYGLFARWI